MMASIAFPIPLNSELIEISIICAIKKPFQVKVPQNGALRDIYLEVSISTTLYRFFLNRAKAHRIYPTQ